MEESMTKVCTRCGRELPVSEFYKGKTACKECTREYNRRHWGEIRQQRAAAKKKEQIERLFPSDGASDEVVVAFLKKVPPRLLIRALYLLGYRGELTVTVTHKVDVSKIGEDTDVSR